MFHRRCELFTERFIVVATARRSHAKRLSISEDALRCNCCITDFPTPLKKHFISVSQPL